MKKQKFNQLCIPDDCWGVVAKYINNIYDLTNFELTCRTFYFIVEEFYKNFFGKKFYNCVDEFLKSDNFISYDNKNSERYINNYINDLFFFNDNVLLLHYWEEDSNSTMGPAPEFYTRFKQRCIFKKNNVYCFIYVERFFSNKFWIPPLYYKDEETEKIVEEPNFKKFVQRIKGLFFI